MICFALGFPVPSSYPLLHSDVPSVCHPPSLPQLQPSCRRRSARCAPWNCVSPQLCPSQVTKPSAHPGPCPASLSPALQSSLLCTPLLLLGQWSLCKGPSCSRLPRRPHLFYFSTHPSPPCAVYTSTLLSVVPRRRPQVFASSPSSPVPIHLNSLLGMSSLSYSPHCLSGPLGADHPSCLVPQSHPAAIRAPSQRRSENRIRPCPAGHPESRARPRQALNADLVSGKCKLGQEDVGKQRPEAKRAV